MDTEVIDDDATAVAVLAQGHGWTVGAAESLTSGAVASVLGAAPRASDWFRGGVVAYSREVRYHLLGVHRGPVVTRDAAVAMARGAQRELRAEIAVAATGAGGPEPEEGQEPGTVWIAVSWPTGVRSQVHHLEGAPAEVVASATEHAVRLLRSVLEDPTGLATEAEGRPRGSAGRESADGVRVIRFP